MSKEEILNLIKLLSALEAVGVISTKLPDYLSEQLLEAITNLTSHLLDMEK